jgi:hypothetical protein
MTILQACTSSGQNLDRERTMTRPAAMFDLAVRLFGGARRAAAAARQRSPA